MSTLGLAWSCGKDNWIYSNSGLMKQILYGVLGGNAPTRMGFYSLLMVALGKPLHMPFKYLEILSIPAISC